MGLLGCAVGILLLPAKSMPIVGMGGGAGVASKQDLARGQVVPGVRVWRRGRPILGFFSGLVFGIGVSVLLWQYNVWLLTTVTAIVVPVVLGILFGIYAWIGRPYAVVAISNAAPPPPASGAAATTPVFADEPAVESVPDDAPPPPPPAAEAPAAADTPATEEPAAAEEPADDDDDEPPPPPPAT
jgi:hypothetical protein